MQFYCKWAALCDRSFVLLFLAFLCSLSRRVFGYFLQKVHFLKIAISFTPLIPCPISPTDDRETTERTPTQLPMTKKCVLLRLGSFTGLVCAGRCHSVMGLFHGFPHRLFPLSNHSTAALLLAPTLYTLHQKIAKNSLFSCIFAKKVITLQAK